MTREEIAIGLAKDAAFKRLTPERQQAVFDSAVQQAGAMPSSATSEAQEPSESLNFPQAIGLGLRETGVAALQGVNAATGGFLKSAYERPIAPSPRLEAMGYTPQPTNRVWPTPQTSEGRFMGAVDTGIGAIAGLPGRAFTGATKLAGQIPKIPAWLARMGAGAVGGAAFEVAQPETYGRNAAIGAVGNVVIPPVVGGASKTYQAIRNRVNPRTIQELMQVSETEVTNLNPKDQQQWFRIRREQLISGLKGQEVVLRQERDVINRELGKAAQDRSVEIRTRLADYLPKRSQHFRDLLEAEMAGRGEIPVAEDELRQYLSKRYANAPEKLTAVSARLGLSNDPSAIPVIGETGRVLPEVQHMTKTLNQVYQQAREFGQTLPQAVRQGLRLYNADEYMTDQAISSLIDFLETKGVNLSTSRGFWRETSSIVNQAVSEFRPFLASETRTQIASSRLKKLAMGIDPDNEVYAKGLADYLGIDNLPGNLKSIVAKLGVNQKAQMALRLSQTELTGAASPLAQSQYVAGKRHEASVEKWNRVLTLLRWVGGGIGAGAGATLATSVLRRE